MFRNSTLSLSVLLIAGIIQLVTGGGLADRRSIVEDSGLTRWRLAHLFIPGGRTRTRNFRVGYKVKHCIGKKPMSCISYT